MRNVILIMLVLVLICGISGCGKDDGGIINSGTTAGSLTGSWVVDQIQMVQAPGGSTPSALMKTALVPFGLTSASTVGECDIDFGVKYWQYIPTNINKMLYHVQFTDKNNGWICEAYGINNFYKTENGGKTWSIVSLSGMDIMTLRFIDNNTGYVKQYIGNKYYITRTTNKGIKWDTIKSINENFSGLYFKNINEGFIIRNSKLQKTTNGGENWSDVFININAISKIIFTDNNNGMFIGKQNNIEYLLKTTNAGDNWYLINIPSNGASIQGENSINFINSNIGWIILIDSNYKTKLYKTNDGGQTWQLINDKELIYSIMFYDDNNGYAITTTNLIQTNDGGNTWRWSICLPNVNQLLGLYVLNKENVFAVGMNGKFYSQQEGTDTTRWRMSGNITNSVISTILKSTNKIYQAYGQYSIINENIVFTVLDYSQGVDATTGTGTINFNMNKATIDLNLPDNEKWKIVMSRK